MTPTPENMQLDPRAVLERIEKEIGRPIGESRFVLRTELLETASLCRRVLAAEEREVQWRAAWRQLVAAVEMTAANSHALQELSKTLTQIIYKK